MLYRTLRYIILILVLREPQYQLRIKTTKGAVAKPQRPYKCHYHLIIEKWNAVCIIQVNLNK